MQIEELFEFVYILIDKKKVTAREISERFGVSTRTVYRWLEALSLSGIPVYSMKGRGGGIAISEKYALDNRILSDEEKLAILSSVKALNSLSGSQNSAVNANFRAVEKLSRLVSGDADWLEVDFAPWNPDGQDVRKLFSTLRESILKKRQLAFDYFRADGNLEKRIVHPWKLVYRGQAWYLQGWCTSRKAERFFKLTRMRNVEMTGRSATVTKKENPSESEKVTQKVPELLKIKALVFPPRISYLLDTFICSQVLPQKDGSILATFSVPDVDWIYDMLLSFHANMKIISPEAVREKVLSLAKNVQKLYED